MATGLIFDIKEFSLHDGDGIRTTVFFKGCPLRCSWCHNPEGLKPHPELFVRESRCRQCGLCRRPCTHADCAPWGRCLHICPEDLISVSGQYYEASELAAMLNRKDPYLPTAVTLSGGEPLAQADFAAELLEALGGAEADTMIETSGFASEEDFAKVVTKCRRVIMDIKLADTAAHMRFTGVSNKPILQNLAFMRANGISYLLRTPLIPGITDTEENLRAIAAIVGNDPIELLPYNRLASAKYPAVDRPWRGPDKDAASPMTMEWAKKLFKNPI